MANVDAISIAQPVTLIVVVLGEVSAAEEVDW